MRKPQLPNLIEFMKYKRTPTTVFDRYSTKGLLIGLCCILFTSCAIGYGPAHRFWNLGNDFGYEEAALDSTTYHVTYWDSSSSENADRLALYRAAELTVQRGFDYFIVTDSRPAKEVGDNQGVLKTIRMFRGAKPADNLSAYSAKELISVMGSPPSLN
jgi:hypothetical protein